MTRSLPSTCCPLAKRRTAVVLRTKVSRGSRERASGHSGFLVRGAVSASQAVDLEAFAQQIQCDFWAEQTQVNSVPGLVKFLIVDNSPGTMRMLFPGRELTVGEGTALSDLDNVTVN